MGLDIVAYSDIGDRIGSSVELVDKDPDNREHFHTYDGDFYGQHDGLEGGVYQIPESADHLHCRIGSYTGYVTWRRRLCEILYDITFNDFLDRTDFFEGRAFSELLNYSDCEGVFGPDTSKKLYQDFCEYEDLIPHFRNQRIDWFWKVYNKWKEGFEVASSNVGVVSLR